MKKTLSLIFALVFALGIYFSAPISVNAAELPEVQVTSVSSTSKGVKIEWEQLDNIEGYIVFKLVQNEAGEYVYKQLAVVGDSTLAFTDQTAVDGETYCYAVAAMDAMGNAGQYSEFAYTYKKLTTLSTPKVSVKSTSSGVKVSWKAIENAESYIVYRRTYNTKTKKYSSWTTLNNACTKTSYTDKKVKLGKTYSYKVKAVNGDVKSTSAATKNIKFNVVPTVEITNAQKGISVKWSKIPSATGYIVYSATYNSKTKKWSSWTNRGTTKSTTSSWTDKKVKNGSIYRYTVRAVYSGGKTGYKATGALRFLTQPTVKIANASDGIKVSWNKNSSATGYTVYRATLTNGKWSSWKKVKTTKNNVFSWVDKKVESGEVYRYTVKATNGNSKSSFKATGKLMFLSQPKVTVSTSASGVKVNWTETTGAIKYAIYRSEYVDGKWTSWFKIATTSHLNLTDSDALKGVKYKYTAKAINGNFKSTVKASSAINGCVNAGSQGGVNVGGNTGNTQPGGNNSFENQILTDPLSVYQKAAKDIHLTGSAGYNKISWQTIRKMEGLGLLDKVIMPILEGFMTDESEAEVKVSPRGSDDAKNRMPISDCDKKYVKSTTVKKDGSNYVITIVMKEQVNPSYSDTDGLAKMSKDFLDYEDVKKESADIAIVKSLDGEIEYVDYTITAEMTKDGEFVSITHNGTAYITANLNGSINTTGEIEFDTVYSDFDYDGNNTQQGGNTTEITDPILKDPLGAYQKAAKEISGNGVAGYSKKGWQTIEREFQFSNSSISSVFGNLVDGFMTTEADAEEKINSKGSDDAKNRMPVSDCSQECIKSATAKKMGDYYLITIVMKEQINPSYDDSDGLAKMSRDFLDVKDIEATIKDDSTVSQLVKNLNVNINYKDYTIVAKMTADGKFIEITHYGVGDVDADITLNMTGSNMTGSGAIGFHAKYYDFQY